MCDAQFRDESEGTKKGDSMGNPLSYDVRSELLVAALALGLLAAGFGRIASLAAGLRRVAALGSGLSYNLGGNGLGSLCLGSSVLVSVTSAAYQSYGTENNDKRENLFHSVKGLKISFVRRKVIHIRENYARKT